MTETDIEFENKFCDTTATKLIINNEVEIISPKTILRYVSMIGKTISRNSMENFAIVDEVDSILIEEARTPLIISGKVSDSTKWYSDFTRIVKGMKRDVHYEIDEAKKQVHTTEVGVEYVESKLGITNLYENTRTSVQRYINAKDKNEIVFTKGATEAINLVANTFGQKYLEEGDEVLLTELEHHSNYVPWHFLRNSKKIKIEFAELFFIPFKSLFLLVTKRSSPTI